MPGRVRRVADDHPNVESVLGDDPFVVVFEDAGRVIHVVVFGGLEGVGEHDAGERLIRCPLHQVVVGGLNIHRRHIVGEQHHLVGVQFIPELPFQIRRLNQAGLQQSHDKGSGARERVEHMHTLIREGCTELFPQHRVRTVQNEVDDLVRGVDDAEAVAGAAEGGGEELLVQAFDGGLLAGGVGDAGDAAANAGVEALELGRFGVEACAVEGVDHLLHDLGDGVEAAEVVAVEQRIEDGAGDEVLGEHLDGICLADGRVEVVAQPADEAGEFGPQFLVAAADQVGDALLVVLRDLGDVVCPVLPIVALSHLLNDFRVDRFAPVGADRRPIHRNGCCLDAGVVAGSAARLFRAVTEPAHVDDLQLIISALVQIDLLDLRLEPFVVGPECTEDFPDDLVFSVVVQCLLGGAIGGHRDRQDDVPVLLGIGFAHHPADGLHHVNLTVPRVEEDHRVEGGNIDPLAQATHIGEDATHVVARVGICFQPVEQVVALQHIHRAVNMFRLQAQPAVLLLGLIDEGDPGRAGQATVVTVEHPPHQLTVFDRAGERDRTFQWRTVRHLFPKPLDTAFGQPVVDAHDSRGIGDVQFPIDRETLLKVRPDRSLIDGKHKHPVVGEQLFLDRLTEAEAVEDRAEGGLVVHAHQHRCLLGRLGAHRLRIDFRSRRHVEATIRPDRIPVVHPQKRGFGSGGKGETGGPMRFVADHQIEIGKPRRLGAHHHIDGLIGREVHGQTLWGAGPTNFGKQLLGAGCGRVRQIGDGVVLRQFADLRIGADGESAHRQGPLGRPLLERL